MRGRLKAIWLFAVVLACSLLWAADEKDAAALPDGAGKDLVAKMCIECHDSGNFRKARMTTEEWTDSVEDMVQRGATGTPAEIAVVVAYLAKNFGKGAPVRINTAPFAELKVVLGFGVPEVRAFLEYRDKNGPLKNIDELRKVPGIDAAKVEAQKAKIVF